jgi:hypothetical protein
LVPPLAFVGFITVSLMLAPFLANPHQFSRRALLSDYGPSLWWILTAGHGGTRWSAAHYAPIRRHTCGQDGVVSVPRLARMQRVGAEWLILALLCLLPLGQARPARNGRSLLPMNIALPVAMVGCGALPLLVSAIAHVAALAWSVVWGGCLRLPRIAASASLVSRSLCVFATWLSWLAIAIVCAFDPSMTLLGWVISIQLKSAVSATVFSLASRDPAPPLDADAAWWSGQPLQAGFSWHSAIRCVWLRETVLKSVEGWSAGVDALLLNLFYAFLFVPVAFLLPQADHWHTHHMLLWSCPQCKPQSTPDGIGKEQRPTQSADVAGRFGPANTATLSAQMQKVLLSLDVGYQRPLGCGQWSVLICGLAMAYTSVIAVLVARGVAASALNRLADSILDPISALI